MTLVGTKSRASNLTSRPTMFVEAANSVPGTRVGVPCPLIVGAASDNAATTKPFRSVQGISHFLSLGTRVRLTIGAQPRAGFARFDFGRRAFRLVGCSALLGSVPRDVRR